MGKSCSSPSIALTSLGHTGVENVCGVIYPPQVALVGCGNVTEVWVRRSKHHGDTENAELSIAILSVVSSSLWFSVKSRIDTD